MNTVVCVSQHQLWFLTDWTFSFVPLKCNSGWLVYATAIRNVIDLPSCRTSPELYHQTENTHVIHYKNKGFEEWNAVDRLTNFHSLTAIAIQLPTVCVNSTHTCSYETHTHTHTTLILYTHTQTLHKESTIHKVLMCFLSEATKGASVGDERKNYT